jgi:hypothetical protein
MDDQEPIQLDFETNQMLSMYANGVSVADIGDKFHKGVNAIYSRMKEHPRDYEAAKGELAMMRNAKYRRAGALAIDLQVGTLEHCHKILGVELKYLAELEKLELAIIENDYDNIVDDPEASQEEKIEARKAIRKRDKVKEITNEAATIRGQFKDFSKVGETAERRADLNEGKATEITEHKGTTLKIEMPEGFKGKNIT